MSTRARIKRAAVVAVFALLLIGFLAAAAHAGDPSGANTGTGADLGFDNLDQTPSNWQGLLDKVGHHEIAINFVWTLVAGALVFFMQAGFAMVETGFCRAKNAAHVVMTNFAIYFIGFLGFWAVGFAIMFGGLHVGTLGGTTPLNGLFEIAKGWGIFGTKGWFLSGNSYDVGVAALFWFQIVFMDTAATIPTGAMAERWKFGAFVIYGFFISMFLYPVFGNWVWGGGWLSQIGNTLHLGHGYLDWAGSTVIHAVGGLVGLAGAMVLGPRIGKFTKDGRPNAMPGHHIPMAMMGTFILIFGWFAFNAGSTLAGNDLRISVIVVNTMVAGSAAAMTAMLFVWRLFGKPDPSMTANGMLAGLVAITAPSGFVQPWSSAVIGIVAGFLVVASVLFLERVWKVDDPVGAVSVHGTCGLWGGLALGLFADGKYGDGFNGIAGPVKGLLYGDAGQFVAQLIGVAVVIVWAFGVAYLFFKAQHKIMGIRSKPEDELGGLDIPEMGALAYPDFLEAQGTVFYPIEEEMAGAAAPSAKGLREEVGSR